MLLCSEAPELHTHTREEARGAARESVTDACRARCAESRGRGTRSFTALLDPRLLVVVWTLESAWRRDREVITRQTGRSSGPAPARAAVGDLGGVARTRDASPPLRRTGPGGRSVPHASGSASRESRRRRRGARRCRWLRGARQCASWTGVAHVGRRTRGETHSETPDGSRDFPRYYGVPPRDR